MDNICKVNIRGQKSPLCNNRNLYNSWKEIFEKKWLSRKIAIGIMYAESHIGANYAGTCNVSWNNWWGIKWRKTDDWKSIKDQKIPNWWNCWLYKFDSVEDYFNSKANTLLTYKSCMNRWSNYDILHCISYTYAWNPKVAESSWIRNSMYILQS